MHIRNIFLFMNNFNRNIYLCQVFEKNLSIILIMNRIKELRKIAGISQTELAKAVGATQRNISYWESNVEINASYAAKIANYFDVSIDYLLGLEDDFGVRVNTSKVEIFSAEEKQLIEDYRTLNFACKKLVKQTIETLKNSSETIKAGDSKNIS